MLLPSPLRLFLCLETPVLVVTIVLLSWGVHVVSDAGDFVTNSGRWQRGASTTTYTTTQTGQIPFYTPSVFTTRAFTSNGDASSYVSTTYTISYAATTSFGTTTAIVTSTSRSYINPPAEYTNAQGEPAVRRRDASWGEGYSNDSARDGLYQRYSDAVSDLGIFEGLLALCIALFALRLAATIASIGADVLLSRRRTSKVDTDKNHRAAYALIATILAVACAAFVTSAIAGSVLWAFFAEYQDLDASDVQATLAFWALSTLTSLVVLIMASFSLRAQRRQRSKDVY